ncbi:hypothetical protein OIN59_21035 [Acidovorax sp. D2M1]|uniref:Uncharacterized protein n=1 Tax=Acidovorax benzenivorans TaxID=2987520 RepID=A0ABT5S469_9BURK|nr:hypothetical protein [Acidovorax benzenivorans]MDD2179933.1 hypothetical protein [Acidovorax benzenivorans]
MQKHILAARSENLSNDQERDLRIAVSDSFKVPVTAVCVVGSAKLGFRLFRKAPNVKKDTPERAQFSAFDDYSDVDVAVISQGTFLSHWRKVYEFFSDGGYTSRGNWVGNPESNDFSYFLTHGWVRPDYLPGTGDYDQRQAWQARVNEINKKKIVSVPVKVGLYFDDKFLMGYHANGIRKIKEKNDRAQT